MVVLVAFFETPQKRQEIGVMDEKSKNEKVKAGYLSNTLRCESYSCMNVERCVHRQSFLSFGKQTDLSVMSRILL